MHKPVLTIFYQFNPWKTSIGGIQTLIKYFIKYAPDTFEVRLVGTEVAPTASIGQWQERTLEGRSLQFFPLLWVDDDNTRRRIPTTLKYAWALRKHNFSSDFMHFHRIEPTLATSGWSGEKALFIHNDIEQQMAGKDEKNTILWQRLPQLYFSLERFLIKQFSQIYSCNSNSSQFYKRQYPTISNRIAFFQNAVDTEIFYPLSPDQKSEQKHALCDQLNLPPETHFFLFAGRLHPQKDPVLLLQAMDALRQINPSHYQTAHLLILGEGELKTTLISEIERLNLSGHVSLLGSYPSKKLATLYQVCRAFVLSSVYEGLPLTVLEALACGAPIITTRSGETTQFLTPETGAIVESRTPTAIATALTQILETPDQFSSEACVHIAQAFSAKSVIQNVYSEMLDRWHRRETAEKTASWQS